MVITAERTSVQELQEKVSILEGRKMFANLMIETSEDECVIIENRMEIARINSELHFIAETVRI